MKKHFYQRITPNGIENGEPVTFSSVLALEEAEKMGISYRQIPGTKIYELQYGEHIEYFRGQVPFQTHYIGAYVADDKAVSKNFLSHRGISVTNGFKITTNDSAEYIHSVFETLTKPLVVKPTNGTQGQKVFMSINSFEDYINKVNECLSFSNAEDAGVIVEEQFTGDEYRILATANKVVAILYRRPANVVGDGHSTLQQLIDQKNSDPRRSDDPNDFLVKIKIDEIVQGYMKDHDLSLDMVPAEGKRVFLRPNSNISTGGDSIDMTDKAHPSVKEIALKTMTAFPGLAFAGIDFMTKDITQAQTADSYIVVEVNKSPGFSIHDFPFEGQKRHATREFILTMFPELAERYQDDQH